MIINQSQLLIVPDLLKQPMNLNVINLLVLAKRVESATQRKRGKLFTTVLRATQLIFVFSINESHFCSLIARDVNNVYTLAFCSKFKELLYNENMEYSN